MYADKVFLAQDRFRSAYVGTSLNELVRALEADDYSRFGWLSPADLREIGAFTIVPLLREAACKNDVEGYSSGRRAALSDRREDVRRRDLLQRRKGVYTLAPHGRSVAFRARLSGALRSAYECSILKRPETDSHLR